jgi:hypothetical protein
VAPAATPTIRRAYEESTDARAHQLRCAPAPGHHYGGCQWLIFGATRAQRIAECRRAGADHAEHRFQRSPQRTGDSDLGR